MILASTTLLANNQNTALAQRSTVLVPGQASAKTMAQVNTLFVNPSTGDDKIGNGSERTPLKTITRALQSATPNTVIILSKGTYNAETGERFPLMLKPGISLQGDESNKGRDIVIHGGGDYLSRLYGSQNVAIVGATQSKLAGVTVTNSNRRGYGLWIEYSSPVVVENTFAGNTQDGIAVTGNSQPSIRHNDFEHNGANGITMSGNSHAEVRENLFEHTGFGINIAQNAQPLVIKNDIRDNRCGIIVQANARPILRNNLIQNNKEDGLVAINQATPDLGTPSEPGGNEFRNNYRYDINASAAKQLIVAYGNILKGDRIIGKINTSNTITAFNSQTAPPLNNNVTRSNNSYLNNPLVPQKPFKLSGSVCTVNQGDRQPLKAQPLTRQPIASNSDTVINPGKINTQVSPQVPTDKSNTPQLNYLQISPNTIEFSAPQSRTYPVSSAPVQTVSSQGESLPVSSAPVQTVSGQGESLPVSSAPVKTVSGQGESLPVSSAPVKTVSSWGDSLPVGETALPRAASVLPVHNSYIPKGNTRHVRKVQASKRTSVKYGRGSAASQKIAHAGQIDLRYRVVVTAGTQQQEDVVRFLAPGSFHTVWHGQEVIQVGVFSNRYNADNMVRVLNNKGLKAVVEPIN